MTQRQGKVVKCLECVCTVERKIEFPPLRVTFTFYKTSQNYHEN